MSLGQKEYSPHAASISGIPQFTHCSPAVDNRFAVVVQTGNCTSRALLRLQTRVHNRDSRDATDFLD